MTNDTKLINITDNAAVEIKKISANEDQKKGLRLGVKGGGCSGLSYAMDFDLPKEKDNIIEFDDFKILIDPKSAIYLKGITFDHEGGLNGKGFVFINPNASNTCGCGESFSV